MAKIKVTKEQTLATINGAMSILEKFPDLKQSDISYSRNESVNPFPFLMDLFKDTVGYNQMVETIAKFIAKYIPIIEVSLKTLLMTKLKDIISCSVNPFLTEEILREGVTFNIHEIDLMDTFKYSPFDQEVGKYYYFDTDWATKPDDLIHSNDMNALLWFMINRANKRYVWKPLPYRLDPNEFRPDYPWTNESQGPDDADIAYKNKEWEDEFYKEKTNKLLSVLNKYKNYLGPAIIVQIDEANRNIKSWRKVRKRSKNKYDYNIEKKLYTDYIDPVVVYKDGFPKDLKTKVNDILRNYDVIRLPEYQRNKLEKYQKNFNKLKKEDGIVTFEFREKSQNLVDAYGNDYKVQTPFNNVLHVFIGDVREKNTLNINKLVTAQTQLQEKESENVILKDKIDVISSDIVNINNELKKLDEQFANKSITEEEYKEQLKKKQNALKNKQGVLDSLKRTQQNLYVLKHDFERQIGDIKNQLYEARDQYFPFLDSGNHRNYYYGKTLFQFNFDYIWSLQLFEERALTARLLDCLTGMLTIDLNFSFKQQLVKNEVRKMVQMIVESDDLTVSDCFFTFTNEDYDEMSRKAELRRAGLLTINGDETSAVKIDAKQLLSSINEINPNATQEKNQAIISGAITELSKQVSNTEYETKRDVNFGVQMNFIENILNALAETLVITILSPKVYLLLLINLKIIGRQTNFNLEGFLGQYKQLIADLIRLVRDELLKFLQEELMVIIGMLVEEISLKLTLEQARYYSRLIKQLIDYVRSYRRDILDFNIDNVDYADILPTEEELEINEKC